MLLSVGGLRKIFFIQNPLTEPPIPVGHILVVYGSDELSSVPPWSVRLGPVEMAVTVTLLFGDLPFFSFGWRLRLSFVTENYPVAVGWGDKSLLRHKTHTDKSVKNWNDKVAGVLFLKFGQMFRLWKQGTLGLLLWTHVSVYCMFPEWRFYMIVSEVPMPATNAVSRTYLILVSVLTCMIEK